MSVEHGSVGELTFLARFSVPLIPNTVLGSGPRNDFTVAELMVDRPGVFGELAKLLDGHELRRYDRHNANFKDIPFGACEELPNPACKTDLGPVPRASSTTPRWNRSSTL